MMNGLTPGPFLFRDKPDFVWAVIASLYIGNLILLILNLPLVSIWVRLLRIPYSILFPAVLALTVVGAYVTRNSVLDVWLVIAFGIFGYLARKIDFPVAPMAFTLILGPLTENSPIRYITNWFDVPANKVFEVAMSRMTEGTN